LLSELFYDLVNTVSLPFHPDLLSALDSAITLTQNPDQFLGVRPEYAKESYHSGARDEAAD
jgi:hypothetical protein